MRIIGYIGCALLVALSALVLLSSLRDQEWAGALAALSMLAICGGAAYILRQGAHLASGRRARWPVISWSTASVGTFLKAVLRMPEGWIFILGSFTSLATATIIYRNPSLVKLPDHLVATYAATFAFWPIFVMMALIRWFAVNYTTARDVDLRSSAIPCVGMVVLFAIPFLLIFPM